ncbi:hypothetical protein [Peptoniphilus sp. oral taxon 386]|uniref:hypothetical protein n=1 Tax=Peptoniphilus sp. oral taxon 386 TaxID=652713 RepID=UPI0001DA9A5E|nr:hypothetical protein [Peptoniphilus sp. oral taxon 386]EFI41912.1 hypothetical protein HMPREF0629_00541 [Peptoniphilus sp. oral taxon 386 str. F0131]
MKSIKKIYSLVIAFVLLIAFAPKVSAQGTYVGLPRFNVTLNGVSVDNSYARYPLIVYKDITYFPMTYNTTRFLGVETNWSEYSGLQINQTGINGKFDFYQTNRKNADVYPVTVPNFKITVNGKTIVNRNEEYPLLVFRDVTYFPMTWRFCVNEFGWKYNFTHQKGLVITSNNNSGGSVPTPKPPENPIDNYKDYSSTIYYNLNYYVIKTNGTNYRLFRESSINKDVKMLSDLEVKSFYQDGNKLYFTSGNSFYSYDMDKGTFDTVISNSNVKDGKIVSNGSQVFYVSASNGELYSKNNVNLNPGAKVETLEKKGNYVLSTFTYDLGVKYKLIVFDKNGMAIYKTEDQTQNAKIEGSNLTYFNVNTMKNETISLNK